MHNHYGCVVIVYKEKASIDFSAPNEVMGKLQIAVAAIRRN